MMDLDEILAEFKARRTDSSRTGSSSTGEIYAREVVGWAEWLAEEQDKTLWEADYVDLRKRITELHREGASASTKSKLAHGTSKFYQDCKKMAERPEFDMPEVPENPFEGLDSEDKKKLRGGTKKSEGVENSEGIYYLSPEEIDQLLDNVPAPRLRNELVIKLLFNCGIRRGELAKIKLKHLDRDDQSIFIPARKSPKPRVVTYRGSYLKFNLDQWLDHGGRASQTYAPESDYLFPTNDSEHLTGKHINTIVKQAADNADLQEIVATYSDGREINKVTAHTLRHSHAVQAVKSGIDVRSLMKLMGHEDLDTTMIYLRLAEDDVKKASRQFTPETVDDYA